MTDVARRFEVPDAPADRRREIGRLAGVLFCIGAVGPLPSTLFLDTDPSASLYLLTALGVCSGAACFAVPWERLSVQWLHAIPVVATLEVAAVVGNYLRLHERLDYEIARHKRHGRRFTVMLLDLDDFKQVNETYGHLEGDAVLRQVGKALASTVRTQDTVARQGGDEFSVLAPETEASEAPGLAARIRLALREIVIGGRPMGASVGQATYPADGTTADDLLRHADLSLRDEKRERRVAPIPAAVALEHGLPELVGEQRSLEHGLPELAGDERDAAARPSESDSSEATRRE